MPKGNKRLGGRSARAGRRELEDDASDVVSVASSNGGSQYGCDADADDTSSCGGGAASWDQFVDALDTAIDRLTDKTASQRTNALLALGTALARRYVPDLLADRQLTLVDGVARCLKKSRGGGGSAELSAAAELCRLLAVQLSDISQLCQLHDETAAALTLIAGCRTAPAGARGRCVAALSFVALLAAPEPQQLASHVQLCETLLTSKSATNNDGGDDEATVQQAVLRAWCLLLTTLPASQLHRTIDRLMPRVCSLLDSGEVEVRVAAGETLALCCQLLWWSASGSHSGSDDDNEQDRDDDEEQDPDSTSRHYLAVNRRQIGAKLRQLAHDSTKTRARKQRKLQRHSFRDIVRTFEEGVSPSESVKFGCEVLSLDSWSSLLMYDTISSVLRSGTNVHLRDNPLVRALLSLGAPLTTTTTSAAPAVGRREPGGGVSKVQRMYQLQETTKVRQQMRSKCRDKRTAVFD